jgi:hypothetical protein
MSFNARSNLLYDVYLTAGNLFFYFYFCPSSVDRRDPVERELVVDTSGGGPVSSQVDPVDGRPGRPRLGAGRSLRLLRPATSPSLSQVLCAFTFGYLFVFRWSSNILRPPFGRNNLSESLLCIAQFINFIFIPRCFSIEFFRSLKTI